MAKELAMVERNDQGRHRPLKIARIADQRGNVCELRDVHVIWAKDDRITFTGDERLSNADGKIVSYR